MLTKCPECELPISDKAITCPHCGYPLVTSVRTKYNKPSKPKRLPNGFGQITELKGRNLRNRFRVMVTVGKNEYGKPIQKLLKPQAYFETYNKAYEALVEYNRSPYSLDEKITVADLFAKWFEEYSRDISPSSKRTITAAWKYCETLHTIPVQALRAYHIKEVMGDVKSPHVKGRIKSVFNLMLDYAVEHELVTNNVARTFNISKDVIKEQQIQMKEHIAFTENEIGILWDNIDMPFVNIILLSIYSGFRPQEICDLKTENISIGRKQMIGGIKTEAGIDRIVPIHPRIRGIVQDLYESAKDLEAEHLINVTDARNCRMGKLTYDKYQYRFTNIIKELGLNENHRPHDGRKTFITLAKKYQLDEYAIKKIVGHAVNDITEKVYTERDPEWLYDEICKISV